MNDNAISILKKAKGIKVGENGIYHGEYKLSFRQERKSGEKGLEAGFQFSTTKDGRRGDIDVDYRFGISHLGAGNSDIQDNGELSKGAIFFSGLPRKQDGRSFTPGCFVSDFLSRLDDARFSPVNPPTRRKMARFTPKSHRLPCAFRAR